MKKIFFAGSLLLFVGACGSKTKTTTDHQTSKTDSLVTVPNDSAIVTTENILKDTNFAIPVITLENKEVSAKINAELTIEKISGYTEKELQEQKKEQENDIMGGLATVEYTIVKNHDYVLSLSCYSEGCGAYCSSWIIEKSFDLKTGNEITIEDLIKPESIEALLKICNKKQNANIDAAKKEHKDDMSKDDMEVYEGQAFVKENLKDFCITNDGLRFQYHFDFPHVMLFAEPDNFITISKDELKDILISHVYGL